MVCRLVGLAQADAVEVARVAQAKERGEAQDATQTRDAALEEQPQWLEKSSSPWRRQCRECLPIIDGYHRPIKGTRNVRPHSASKAVITKTKAQEAEMFKRNLGTVDRAVRIVLGVILAAISMLVFKGTASTIVGIVALIPLITGIVGFCPLYVPLKLSTVKAK